MGSFWKRQTDVKQDKAPTNGKAAQPLITNALARQIRILNERLAVLEQSVSTLRRDFNRIERREYRQKETSQFETPSSVNSGSTIWEGLQRGH